MFTKPLAAAARLTPNALMGVATIFIAYGMIAGIGQIGVLV